MKVVSRNKHFSELVSHHGGKTAGMDPYLTLPYTFRVSTLQTGHSVLRLLLT